MSSRALPAPIIVDRGGGHLAALFFIETRKGAQIAEPSEQQPEFTVREEPNELNDAPGVTLLGRRDKVAALH